MKALFYERYGTPDVLRYGDLPEPALPPGGALVDIVAASVNPIDWKIRNGSLAKYFPQSFPAIPGRDGVGVVAALAADAADAGVRVGDPVCFIGRATHAGRVALPAATLVPRPAGAGDAVAAAFPLSGLTAWKMLKAAPLRAGQRALVHAAAGGVGGLLVQLLRLHDVEVLATASGTNVDYVRGLGAAEVAAYDREDFASRFAGVDVVYDGVGGAVHARSYPVLRRGGALVYITALPVEDRGAEYGVTVTRAVVDDSPADLRELAALVADGRIVPQAEKTFPLADGVAAHRLSETGHARGKLVLTMR